ncbi:MAG: acetyl-CoA carboxylase biotin carboxylase subunit [Dehalococcoidia bacterium]
MFSTLLIANRGEIACRVIRTCKLLGIRAVAVYSDADEKALHVQMADEAVHIGGSPVEESYLNAESIIKAAKKVKAEAIHPGYGFLSEAPAFAKAVEEAGLVFVGPSAEVISQMGDKVAARRQAKAAGVPLIPGSEGEITDQEAREAAKEIGFPLMVKAVDGGGGMGIRLVNDRDELTTALKQARKQALNSFGSDRVYLEKRVENGSHVEIQVFGDNHGNAIHLFERDCSVQRRNQKVIEETPCPKLSPEVLEAMAASAVNLTKSIGYSNAGTIEFLLDQDREHFYFLEMNTRLQVEHAITEMVTGIDLVELQLRVAAGEELPFGQDEITRNGAAIEARIYPEDPATLLPTAGKVEELSEPESYNVRVDSALYEGYEVSPHYESMMAKLIVRGKDRQTAIQHMRDALDQYKVEGVVTNIPLIADVMEHPSFTGATYHNSFLEQWLTNRDAGSGKEMVAAIAVAMVLEQEKQDKSLPSKWKIHGRRGAMVNRLNGGGI